MWRAAFIYLFICLLGKNGRSLTQFIAVQRTINYRITQDTTSITRFSSNNIKNVDNLLHITCSGI